MSSNDNTPRPVFTVLCIDGGGVRGLVPARILQELEERTGKPVCEMFDLIGGPSTGSIVAAGLSVPDPEDPSKPKYSAEELKNFYLKHTPKIFPEMTGMKRNLKMITAGCIYDPKPLEDALETAFGETRMRDSLTSLMIPAVDIKSFRPVWITNFKGEKDRSKEGWSSMRLKDAVRASTTAPLYFPVKWVETTPDENMPHVTSRHALIDGGFFSGGTLRRLMTQARRMAPPDADIVLVHLGTGALENSLSPEEFNRLGLRGMVSKAHGSVLVSLSVNMSIIDAVDDLKEEMGDKMIDIDAKMSLEDGPMSMDDASDYALKRLTEFAEKLIDNKADDIDRLCQIMKRRSSASESRYDSQQALAALGARLRAEKEGRDLTTLYRRMLELSGGIVDAEDEDSKHLRQLMGKLSERDRKALTEVYKERLNDIGREHGGRLRDALGKIGDDIKGFFNKLGRRKDDDTPPEDKKPPAPARRRKDNDGDKRRFG